MTCSTYCIHIHVLVHRVAVASKQLPPPSTPLAVPVISPRMVNYHNPIVIQQDVCACAFAAEYMDSGSLLTSFDSGRIEFLACSGWTLLVCLSCRNISKNNNRYNPVLNFSWEFVTNLDYEWSVIRGHHPFRWTTCVSINALFLLSVGSDAELLSRLADLYHYAHIHSCRHNTYPGGYGRYSSI